MFNVFERKKAYADLHSTDFEKALKADKNSVLIDVRTKGEFNAGKLPGAVNIDLMNPDFLSRIAGLDQNKSYYVYCRSGSRSAQACGILASKGLRAANLAGGIISWRGEIVS